MQETSKKLFDTIGIDEGYIILALAIGLIAVLVMCIVLMIRLKKAKKNYDTFMEGKDGRNLESTILSKFEEINSIKESTEGNIANINTLQNNSKFCFQKFAINKYDAFKEMGGKLSFSLCMLTENDDGMIITSMHSRNEGCYTYIKEIIKGESYIMLGEEEKKVLEQAKNRKSCLDD